LGSSDSERARIDLFLTPQKPHEIQTHECKKLIAAALLTLVSVPVHAGDPRLENVRPVITINGAKEQNKLTPDASSATMVVTNQKFGPEKDRPVHLRFSGSMVIRSCP